MSPTTSGVGATSTKNVLVKPLLLPCSLCSPHQANGNQDSFKSFIKYYKQDRGTCLFSACLEEHDRSLVRRLRSSYCSPAFSVARKTLTLTTTLFESYICVIKTTLQGN